MASDVCTIVDSVRLKFNPEVMGNSKMERRIRDIFRNDVARTLWLAIQPPSWDACKSFDRDCLNAAEVIGEDGVPDSPESLVGLLYNVFAGPSYGLPFAEELLPYLTGEKTIKYEVS